MNRRAKRTLISQMSTELKKSHHWVIIMAKGDGIHLHAPGEDDLFLLGALFSQETDLFEEVKEYVKYVKSGKAKLN